MNMNSGQRLARLEAVYQPVDHAVMTDDDRRWFLGLCASSAAEVLRQFAELLAERRFLDEIGLPSGARSGWAGDWCVLVPEDERAGWIQAELDRLATMSAEAGDDALDDWLESADRNGWPPVTGPTFTMDRAGFEEMVTRRRQSLDTSRGCDMPGSEMWRRAHPEWRPGISGDEAAAFELELLDEADRLEVEWFGADVRAAG